MYLTGELAETLDSTLEACQNILISGAPGIGKSEIIYQVCQAKGLRVYEVRLYEQGEAAIGFPRIDSAVTLFTIPFWFHDIQEERPDVVVFDDFHLVDASIQKYLYRFLTSRIIHNHHLGYTPKLIVAGNFDISTAGSCDLQAPVSSRFDLMIKYEPDPEVFLNWGYETKRIDSRILAFLKANPELLYTADPPLTQMYPCPRTWEKLSQLIAGTERIELAQGVIGEEAATRLLDFWPLLSKTPQEIVSESPTSLKPAERLASLYILASHIGDGLTKGKVDSLTKESLEWVNKLNPDMVFIFCRMCLAASSEDHQKAREGLVNTLSSHSPKLYRKVLRAAVALVEGFEDRERVNRAVAKGVKGASKRR